MKLYKLGWDITGSEFAGRHQLYEKFYAGHSAIIRGSCDREAPWDDFTRLSTGRWRQRRRTPVPPSPAEAEASDYVPETLALTRVRRETGQGCLVRAHGQCRPFRVRPDQLFTAMRRYQPLSCALRPQPTSPANGPVSRPGPRHVPLHPSEPVLSWTGCGLATRSGAPIQWGIRAHDAVAALPGSPPQWLARDLLPLAAAAVILAQQQDRSASPSSAAVRARRAAGRPVAGR